MLLRRIIEHVKAQAWTAIGIDFVIVVVGVFIGIQVANWNDDRNRERREAIILRQLATSLKADLTTIDRELQRFRRITEGVPRLLNHLAAGKPYDPSLDAAFGLVYGFASLPLDRAAYESLKSEGLDLISNDELRGRIAGVYEKTYGQIDRSMDGERDVVLYLRPYFLEHFRDLSFGQSATPIDYPSLLEDEHFRNLAEYRLQAVRQNQLKNLEDAQLAMKELVEAIELSL